MSLTGALPSWQTRSLPKQNTTSTTRSIGGMDPAGQGSFGGNVTSSISGTGSGLLGNVTSTPQSSWAPIGTLAGNIGSTLTSPYGGYGGYTSPLIGELGVLQSQIPYIWQDKNLSGQQMQSQAEIDRSRIDLRRQLLGIDGANLGYDTGYFTNLKGLLGKERGIADQQYQLRLEQMNADANNKMRDHKSNQVAGGSLFAAQTQRGFADIYANLDRNRKGATYDYQREGIGFDRQAAGLDRDLFRNGTDKQKLTLMGKQLDMDSKELETKLKFGLQQLGLDADKALAQILGQMDSLGQSGDPLIQSLIDFYNKYGAPATQLGNSYPYNGNTGATGGGAWGG
jgi:hypothetical protein